MSHIVTHLTSREREILVLMMDGLSNNEIAERLCVEQSTLKRHRQNLYHKTGTHDPAGLIAWGHRWLRVEYIEIGRLLNPEDEDGSRNLHRSG